MSSQASVFILFVEVPTTLHSRFEVLDFKGSTELKTLVDRLGAQKS